MSNIDEETEEVQESLFPTLDKLRRYRLRSAYVVLMLGARSTSHFEKLHDELIDEHNRVPHNILMALCKERQRFLGIPDNAPSKRGPRGLTISYRPRDKWLVEEFRQASVQSTLYEYYRDVLETHTKRTPVKEPSGLRSDYYRIRRPDEHGHLYAGFTGTWMSFGCEVSMQCEIPVLDSTPNVDTQTGSAILHVCITLKGIPTRNSTKELMKAPRWNEMHSFTGSSQESTFTYSFNATPIIHLVDTSTHQSRDHSLNADLDEAAFAELLKFLANEKIVLSDLTTNWRATRQF